MLCESCTQSTKEKRVWLQAQVYLLGSLSSFCVYILADSKIYFWHWYKSHNSWLDGMPSSSLLTCCSNKGCAHEPVCPDEVQKSCIFLVAVSTSNEKQSNFIPWDSSLSTAILRKASVVRLRYFWNFTRKSNSTFKKLILRLFTENSANLKVSWQVLFNQQFLEENINTSYLWWKYK